MNTPDYPNENRLNEVAADLTEATVALEAAIGEEGLAKIGNLMRRIARNNLAAFGRLFVQAPALVENWLGYGDRGFVCDLLDRADRVAEIHPLPAARLLTKSPDILERLGREGMQSIFALAAAVAVNSYETASHIVDRSPLLADTLTGMGGRSLALQVFRTAEHLAGKRWGIVSRVLDKSPVIVKRLLESGPPTMAARVYALADRAGECSPAVAAALLEKSGDLVNRLGFGGLEKVSTISLRMAGQSPDSAVRFIQNSPGVVDRLLQRCDTATAVGVLDLAAGLSLTSPLVAAHLCQISPEVIPTQGLCGLETIAQTGIGLDREGWQVALGLMEASPAIVNRVGLAGLSRVAELSRRISTACCRSAAVFSRKSPEIIDRVSVEGLEDFAALCTSLARDGSSVSTSFLENGADIFARLQTRGGRKLLRDVHALVMAAARKNPIIAFKIFEKSPDLVDRIGFEGLERVVRLTMRVAVKSWTVADSLLKACTDVIRHAGFSGFGRLAQLSLRIAQENVFGAVCLIEMSPKLMARLDRNGGREVTRAVYAFGRRMAKFHWTVTTRFIEKSPEIREVVGDPGVEKIAELCSRLAGQHPRLAVGMLDVCLEIVARGGIDTLCELVGLAVRLGRHDPESGVQVLRNGPGLIDRLYAYGDQRLVRDVHLVADRVAQHNWRAGLALLEKSPDHLDAAGFECFETIAHRVLKVSRISEAEAIRFARGESIDFADFVRGISRGLALKTVKPVLSRYLTALLGAQIEIAEAGEPHTDGKKLYLPKQVREFESDDENFVCYKVLATHLEAHLEFGSFEFELGEARDLAKELEGRYGRAAGTRGSDMEKLYELFPEPTLARDLINLLEDHRIESRLKQEYPALAGQIETINAHMLYKRARRRKNGTNGKQRALEAIGEFLLTGKNREDPPEPVARILEEVAPETALLEQSAAGIYSVIRAAAGIYQRLHAAFSGPYSAADPLSKPIDQKKVEQNIGNFKKLAKQIGDRLKADCARQHSRTRDGNQGPADGSGKVEPSDQKPNHPEIARSRPEQAGDRPSFPDRRPGSGAENRRPGSLEEKEDGESNGSLKFASTARVESLLRKLFREKRITPKEIEARIKNLQPDQVELFLQNLESTVTIDKELESEKETHLYPEWSRDINGHRGNWARIRNRSLDGSSLRFYHKTVLRHTGLIKKIKREFQMLKPDALRRTHRQLDGNEIDLDAAVETLIDRKTGLSPSEKNYIRIEKNHRDIAVAFLIDMSRSTKGIPIKREKEALIIMSEALQEVGDAFGIFGFSGDNRDNVDFYRIKDFEERYNQRVKAKISAIDFRFENRDGTAIRHISSILKRREERTKLMVLLSDGKPLDKDYSGQYAIEDTRAALMEARKSGIHTFCITIDKEAADYLPKMYRHSNWIVIDDVNQLPANLSKIYGRLTN